MSYRSKYFKIDEYICRCGCGLIRMSDNAIYGFDKVREAYGSPMIITWGCRCKKHNEKVGGKPDSAHLPAEDGYCYGADFKALTSQEKHDIVKAAIQIGCKRIGIAKDFIHLDFSPYLPQKVIWVY